VSKKKTKPENRTGAGRFQKGASGNPGGRPKVVAEVRDLARQHTPEVIATLALLAKSADSDTAKVAACKELLDRAWGKAPQELKAEVSFSTLTDEQLEAKLKAIVAAVGL
jgi:hypothetical protein